jgi:hypothetical protein
VSVLLNAIQFKISPKAPNYKPVNYSFPLEFPLPKIHLSVIFAAPHPKINVVGISKQPSPVLMIGKKKQLESVEYLYYLCSLKTNDARRQK